MKWEPAVAAVDDNLDLTCKSRTANCANGTERDGCEIPSPAPGVAQASVFGEPQMKGFAGHTVDVAERFQADVRVALLHYWPVSDILHGEPLEIYPFLGLYLLGEPIDEFQLDLALHGHAHAGVRAGHAAGRGARAQRGATDQPRRLCRLRAGFG